MASRLTLKSGAKTTSRKVTDLQRRSKEVVDEALGGADVLLSKNGTPVVALVGLERYIETQDRAARSDELDIENAQLRAKLGLLAAGGPSLEQVRLEADGKPRISAADMLVRAMERQAGPPR